MLAAAAEGGRPGTPAFGQTVVASFASSRPSAAATVVPSLLAPPSLASITLTLSQPCTKCS